MDPFVGWFQEEQEGPSLRTWFAIWETNALEMQQQFEQQQLQQKQNSFNNNSNTNSNNNNNCETNTTTAFQLLQQFGGDSTQAEREKIVAHERNCYNPTRRKAGSIAIDNKASTYNMNKYHDKLIGKYKGCP